MNPPHGRYRRYGRNRQKEYHCCRPSIEQQTGSKHTSSGRSFPVNDTFAPSVIISLLYSSQGALLEDRAKSAPLAARDPLHACIRPSISPRIHPCIHPSRMAPTYVASGQRRTNHTPSLPRPPSFNHTAARACQVQVVGGSCLGWRRAKRLLRREPGANRFIALG